MARSVIVSRSFNPYSRQDWVRGWRKIRTYPFRAADRVNARSSWLAWRIRTDATERESQRIREILNPWGSKMLG